MGLVSVVSVALFLGLAVVGWGSFAAFFAHPARTAVAVDGPDIGAVAPCRQPGADDADRQKHGEHPAVGAILAFARAEVALGEQRRDHEPECDDGDGGAGRVREERGEPTPGEDGEAEEERGRDHTHDPELEFVGHDPRPASDRIT